ncbi:MAG: hypothetical protein IK008_05825 [Bacteroidales bacterium]|nr:hypothetical protein [Bacteroidales bacterium]
MKKFFSFAAICALLISCGNKNNAEVVVDNPQKDNSGLVVFNTGNPQVEVGDSKKVTLNSINHFPNGSYVGEGVQTKVVGEKVVGRFVASDGVYQYTSGELAGCTLTRGNGGALEFTDPKGGKTSGNGTFTPGAPASDPVEVALTGAHWKLSSIEAKVKDKNIKVNFNDKDGINPNDVEKVAEYINKKGANIPMDKVKGYYIKSISLNPAPANSIIVEFEGNVKAIEGTWAPLIKSKTFSYQLNASLDGQLFDAEASGSFDFEDNYQTLVLTMNAKSDSGIADIIIKAKKIN